MTLSRLLSASRPRRTTAVVGALAWGVLALSGCSASDQSATGSKGYIAGDGTIVVIESSDRPDFPQLSGDAVGGGAIDSTAYAGSPIVVNVWASWCAPCRAEADDLVRASKRLGDVQFLGINSRDEPSAAEAFVRSYRVSYPSLLDLDGSQLLNFYGLFNLRSLPTTMVIDSEGRIAALATGPITETTLVDVVHDVTGGA